jgi:hypothetical protein
MLTPSQIVAHLKTYLPLYTDKFTVSLTVASASMGASNVLTVTSTGHGLTVGRSVVLTAGTIRNPLTASQLDGDNVEFTTKNDHDQTAPQLEFDQDTLTLGGFTGGDTAWNGTHDIEEVANRRNFTIALPAGETLAPSVDESQYLQERIFTGVYEVVSVPDADTFTLSIADMPTLPTGTVDNLAITTGFNICAAANFQRAEAIYTEQDPADAYLFVIMTDGAISQDRHTFSDAHAAFTPQDENLLTALRNFSIAIILPTDDDTSGSDAQDEAYGDLYTALLKTLFGYEITGQPIPYKAVPTGDGPTAYNTAYYGHVYDFQLPSTLTIEDGFIPENNVAFRDLELALKLFADPEADFTANINLDDEAL